MPYASKERRNAKLRLDRLNKRLEKAAAEAAEEDKEVSDTEQEPVNFNFAGHIEDIPRDPAGVVQYAKPAKPKPESQDISNLRYDRADIADLVPGFPSIERAELVFYPDCGHPLEMREVRLGLRGITTQYAWPCQICRPIGRIRV